MTRYLLRFPRRVRLNRALAGLVLLCGVVGAENAAGQEAACIKTERIVADLEAMDVDYLTIVIPGDNFNVFAAVAREMPNGFEAIVKDGCIQAWRGRPANIISERYWRKSMAELFPPQRGA